MKQNRPTATVAVKSASRGYVFVALAAIMWASGGAAAKFLFNRGTTAFDLIQLRTSLSFIGLFAWLAISNPNLLRISTRDSLYFLVIGIFGIAAAQFFYLFAISKISVAAAILLHYTGPLFIVLYKVIFAREKLKASTVMAMAATLAGCALVVEAYNPQALMLNRVGVVGGLLAAVAFAVYSLLSEYGMRRYPPWTVLVYALLFAALGVEYSACPIGGLPDCHHSLQEWGWIAFIALIGTILPFGLYFKGIRLIRSDPRRHHRHPRAGYGRIDRLSALDEIMGPLQILGG